MHIHQLSGSAGKSRSLSCYRLAYRQIFQLVCHQICRLSICRACDSIDTRPWIFYRVIVRPRCVRKNFIQHPRLSIYEVQLLFFENNFFLRCYFRCRNILPNIRQQGIKETLQQKLWRNVGFDQPLPSTSLLDMVKDMCSFFLGEG
jgi:hypothetical protein